MWLIRRLNGVLWVSVQRGKLARFVPAPCMAFCGAFAPDVGICPCMQRYRARRVLWCLLGLWLRLWLLHPVSISARIGSAWSVLRILGAVFCSSDWMTASGILGGVLGLLVLLPRLLGVWRGFC